MPRIKPLLVAAGGPVLMVQVRPCPTCHKERWCLASCDSSAIHIIIPTAGMLTVRVPACVLCCADLGPLADADR